MSILIAIIIIETFIIWILYTGVKPIEEENKVLKTENHSLKRAMYENNLIPEKYVNND